MCLSINIFLSFPFHFFARKQCAMEKHALLFPSFLHLKEFFNFPFKMSIVRFYCWQFCFNTSSLKPIQVLISQ